MFHECISASTHSPWLTVPHHIPPTNSLNANMLYHISHQIGLLVIPSDAFSKTDLSLWDTLKLITFVQDFSSGLHDDKLIWIHCLVCRAWIKIVLILTWWCFDWRTLFGALSEIKKVEYRSTIDKVINIPKAVGNRTRDCAWGSSR